MTIFKRYTAIWAVILAILITQLWIWFALSFFTPACRLTVLHFVTGDPLPAQMDACPANPFT